MTEHGWRFNPPPGWPALPPGWQPPEGWTPNPSWAAAPEGWSFWIPDSQPTQVLEPLPRRGTSSRTLAVRWVLGGVAGVALLGGALGGWASLLVVAGLLTVIVAVVALVRGGLPWLRLKSRAAASMVGGVGVAVLVIGSTLAPAQSSHTAASARSSGSGPTAAASTPPTPSLSPSPSPSSAAIAPAGSALAIIAVLPVKGRAPQTGYSRDAFGPAWADLNHNGCDTRNDMLRRDLNPVTVTAATRGCVVTTGVLADPYTATTIRFVRGDATSRQVEIDHIVALADAWQTGAQHWTTAQREAFANDPLELLAVDAPTNDAKGDGDAATWLPPNKAFRCAYVARQVSIKHKYRLWVTAAEQAAIQRVLTTCPTQPVVTAAAAAKPQTPTASTIAPPPPTPVTTTAAPPPTPTAPPAADCTPGYDPCIPPGPDVDCAGGSGDGPRYVQGPIRVTGSDTYDLDRDHDGIGCE